MQSLLPYNPVVPPPHPPPSPSLCLSVSLLVSLSVFLSVSGSVSLSFLTHMHPLLPPPPPPHMHTEMGRERDLSSILYFFNHRNTRERLINLYQCLKHSCCSDLHDIVGTGLFIQPRSVMLVTACFMENGFSPPGILH